MSVELEESRMGIVVGNQKKNHKRSWLDSHDNQAAIQKFPVAFKRFRFEDKYRRSVIWSLQSIRWSGDLDSREGSIPFPWEVSLFAMLSMFGEEETARPMNYRESVKLMNFIRNNMFMFFDADIRCHLPTALAAVEYRYQYNFKILLQRFLYFFKFQNSELDMPLEILSRLGVAADALIDLAFLLVALGFNGVPFEVFGQTIQSSPDCFFSGEMIDALKALSIPKQEFSTLQQEHFGKSPRGYFLARNVLDEHPFILVDDKYFLPAPHLAVLASTYGALSRITRENNPLCSRIGKYVQEPYLLKLFQNASCYQSVSGEIKYGSHKSSDSPDVIACDEDFCLLIDSKFSRPSFKIRDLTIAQAKEAAEKYSEYVKQLFKQLSLRSQYLDREFDDEHVFGLIVVFEDSLVFREFVYDAVSRDFPDDIDYIKRHIHIVPLQEVEKFCYHHLSIIPAVVKWSADDASPNDFCLVHDGVWPPLDVPEFDSRVNDVNGLINRIIVRVKNAAI